MAFANLTSIGHNLATSISGGLSFLLGAYEIDVHEQALADPAGHITLDLLAGVIVAGSASTSLQDLVRKTPNALAALCLKHGAMVDDFAVITARYGVDEVYGRHFTVIVEDRAGRRSEEIYEGFAGRRLRRGHRPAHHAN